MLARPIAETNEWAALAVIASVSQQPDSERQPLVPEPGMACLAHKMSLRCSGLRFKKLDNCPAGRYLL